MCIASPVHCEPSKQWVLVCGSAFGSQPDEQYGWALETKERHETQGRDSPEIEAGDSR